MNIALRLQRNLLHFALIQKCDAPLGQFAAQGILQAPAVDLIRRERSFGNLAVFHTLGDILVAIGAKEHTQTKLAQVLCLQMLFQAQDIAQIVGSNLDGRLAHFMGSLWDRMLLLLDDEDLVARDGLFLSCQARVKPAIPPPMIATSY